MAFLKLEIGKYYRDGDGIVRKIDRENDNLDGIARGYKFIGGGRAYTEDGLYNTQGSGSNYDLLEEVGPGDFLDYPNSEYRKNAILTVRQSLKGSKVTKDEVSENIRKSPIRRRLYEECVDALELLFSHYEIR